MNDSPQESQPFRDISTILPDRLLRSAGVSSQESFDALGLRKQVRRVTQLRCLNRNPSFELHDVFIAEEVEPSRPPAELEVEERFVVGLPREPGDVEVPRDTDVPAKAAQLFPLHRLTLDAGADLVQGV